MFDNSVFVVDETNLDSRIAQATYYLQEYEKEVARAQGAASYTFRSKEDALGRIKILVEFAPDDPRIQDLFQRAKNCVKGGAGNISTVDPSMLLYLENEENLRKHFAEVSEKAWNEMLASYAADRLEKTFPAPDFNECLVADMKDKIVVLDNVRYPDNQFMGTTGEYVSVGTRSDGLYFVRIDGRDWLAPYEAVKRYRRQVDTTMLEVKEWSVIGKIVDLTCESPDAGESKLQPPTMGWEIAPIALYVPGHVMALRDESGEHTGRFIDEEKVAAMKDSWYTVKEVPADVTPERLVEIFMAAIKEKNFDLFMECIDPARKETPVQKDLINYHWDLHQERFHFEYVHANIDAAKTEIKITKGYDDTSVDTFFLDEEEVAKIRDAYGEKEEEAIVVTAAIDKNGKQLGTPSKHILRRVNGGRWYISTFEVRF